MRFECKDLERALEVPELLPDAREHARDCPVCRRELWLWSEMSNVAGGLREQWDSPGLWPRTREGLAAEIRQNPPKRGPLAGRPRWHYVLAVAATVLVVIGVGVGVYGRGPASRGNSGGLTSNGDFLTEQALQEVEQTEAAYSKSIDKLAELAKPEMEHTSTDLALAYRERLMVLDQAIAELRSNVDQNRFNASLQLELAGLYRQKQQTLQEILRREHKN